MAKLNITDLSETIRKQVAQAALNNTSKSSALTLVNTGARQYPVGNYVALWDETTYATPDLDANARIGVVTARTNTTVSVDWGQFGTPIIAYANRPTLAVVDMGEDQIEAEDQRSYSDALSETISGATKTVNATTDAGLDHVVTHDGANITLPTPAAGLRLDFVNGGNTDGAVGFTLTVGTGISVLGLNSAATSGQTIVNTKVNARVGDRITLIGSSATVWYARAVGNFDRV